MSEHNVSRNKRVLAPARAFQQAVHTGWLVMTVCVLIIATIATSA